MEVKLMSVVHLVAGHCGPESLVGSAQRWAKSHSLNHAHMDSKGVPESLEFLILGMLKPPQLMYLAIVQSCSLMAATHASNVRVCG